MKRGEKQALAFIDPKGLRLDWPQEKIEMLQGLDKLDLSLPVRGFLVTHTDQAGIQGLQGWPKDEHVGKLDEYHIILQQEPAYISKLLNKLKECL